MFDTIANLQLPRPMPKYCKPSKSGAAAAGLALAILLALPALSCGAATDTAAAAGANTIGSTPGASAVTATAADSTRGTAVPAAAKDKPSIVVTYSTLGAVVRELAGDDFSVHVVIPNGLDVHEWEPSAQDIERVLKADLIVENGLGLEEGLSKVLTRARDQGVAFFTASDHIRVRHVGPGEGIPSGDPDQATGAADPHIWTDPSIMKTVVAALAQTIRQNFGVDLESRSAAIQERLEEADRRISAEILQIPPEKRVLVTGHESLGYFAQHYGFKLSGAIIPSLSTQAGVSAADMAALGALIKKTGVRVVFTELGTPPKVAEALANETKVKLIELSTHALPPDGSYFTFIQKLADAVTGGLR